MRYVGVDLHTTQITVCYLTEKDEISIRKYQIVEIEKFIGSLSKTDELAVEATGNTRWFVSQVKEAVGRSWLLIREVLKWFASRLRRLTNWMR